MERFGLFKNLCECGMPPRGALSSRSGAIWTKYGKAGRHKKPS